MKIKPPGKLSLRAAKKRIAELENKLREGEQLRRQRQSQLIVLLGLEDLVGSLEDLDDRLDSVERDCNDFRDHLENLDPI